MNLEPNTEQRDDFSKEELREIVEQARKGDHAAFTKLYQKYFTPLYRYVFFRVSDKTEAEDLVQDVFVKAYTSFSRFTLTGISPLAFFYTIARNRVIDHYRKKRAIIIEDEEFEFTSIVDENMLNPEEDTIQKEEIERLKEHIATLPEDQRDAVSLRFINGLSTPEISAVLGKSEPAVRQLQSRGLRFLRKLVSGIKGVRNIERHVENNIKKGVRGTVKGIVKAAKKIPHPHRRKKAAHTHTHENHPN